jgi:hypothetical protein
MRIPAVARQNRAVWLGCSLDALYGKVRDIRLAVAQTD